MHYARIFSLMKLFWWCTMVKMKRGRRWMARGEKIIESEWIVFFPKGINLFVGLNGQMNQYQCEKKGCRTQHGKKKSEEIEIPITTHKIPCIWTAPKKIDKSNAIFWLGFLFFFQTFSTLFNTHFALTFFTGLSQFSTNGRERLVSSSWNNFQNFLIPSRQLLDKISNLIQKLLFHD